MRRGDCYVCVKSRDCKDSDCQSMATWDFFADQSAGEDPGFLDRGFKFRKGVRFLSFASIFLKFPMKMK